MAGNLTAMIASIFSGGVTADPYYEYTTLLLPGNGTDGQNNNAFLDSSTNNFPITRNGNTTQGTFSPFSQTGWGNYFDGNGDYLSTTPSSSSFSFGTGDFTIEYWVYINSGTNNGIFQLSDTAGGLKASQANTLAMNIYLNNSVSIYANGTSYSSASNVLPYNLWTHFAIVRSSNVLKVYANGSLVTSIGSSGSITDNTNYTGLYVAVGGYYSTSFLITGYVSNFRVVKNQALYTGAFTPATSALTVSSVGSTGAGVPTQTITGTVSLLTCQSNRFIDKGNGNSGSGFTITVNGNPSVVAFSPFNPTLPWSSATNGGSGYFDGSGDYLSIADNAALDLGNSDFTIEGWFYMPSAPSSSQIVGLVSKWGASGQKSWSVYFYNAGGTYQIYLTYTTDGSTNQNLYNQGFVFPAGQWAHIAVVRSTTTVKFYINGSVAGTGSENISTNTVFDSTSSVAIASDTSTGANYLTGYTSSIRIVKGTAVYTAAFTPPTAPLTAITNTSLLLNFTNAGIYDATSKNDLETVGNAQISTTQSKWGGSSISFDGTGDWLLIPDQPPQRIGTGNFTVEMWVYRNSSGTYGLAGKGTGTTGWLVSLNSSNQVVFTYGSSTITSTGTVSATTWAHIAVVREGTSTNQTKIYINGTNDGTGTVSTDFNQTNSMYIGADRTGGSAANAYVQDVRITNYARYTANFTAPTAAFPTL